MTALLIIIFILLVVTLVFSILNFILLLPFVRIATKVVDALGDDADEGGRSRPVAVEEPGLIDLDATRSSYSGVPVRLD